MYWTLLLEFTTGIYYWNLLLEFTTGIYYWNLLLEFTTGMTTVVLPSPSWFLPAPVLRICALHVCVCVLNPTKPQAVSP